MTDTTRRTRSRAATPSWRRIRLLAITVLVAIAALLNVPTAAGQDAPADPNDLTAADLAVADGFGYATPVGTMLRIPNELPGGALLSKTDLSLGKTIAIAAGYTPGELGEAFLRTTVVPPEELPEDLQDQLRDVVSWDNPTLFTAQTPASDVFPAEASLADGGVNAEPIAAGSLRAATTDTMAEANAVGGLTIANSDLTIGNAGSHSRSEVLDDGTVISEAHAFISDIRLAGGLLRIGGIDSTARVAFRPGHEPEHDLRIEVAGAEVLGIPVTIDQHGIRVADTPILGLGEIAGINDILHTLAEEGLSLTLFPGVVEEIDDRSVRVAGAALSIRGNLTDYVPTAIDTPLGPVGSPLGDVGTDNEILLGQVEAFAFAAERGPPPDFGPPPADASIAPSPEATPTAPAPALASEPPAPATPTTGADSDQGPSEVAAPPAGGGEFELIRRQESPGVVALRAGYRWVLLAALVGTIAYLVRLRTRFV